MSDETGRFEEELRRMMRREVDEQLAGGSVAVGAGRALAAGRARGSGRPIRRLVIGAFVAAVAGLIAVGGLYVGSESSKPPASTSTIPSTRQGTPPAVIDLPFPIAYTTGGSDTYNVWVAGKGRRPTRVAQTEFSALHWSNNGRYLVTVVNSYGSPSVWRYDDDTGTISTWKCGGCQQAVAVGDQIVAVNSKLQLLRFPLSGGKAEPPLAITGLPSWSRSRQRTVAIPDAVGGTDSAVLLTWPIQAGASDVWGAYVLVGLDGRYLRTVVRPGKAKIGVSITSADYVFGGDAMVPGNRSALVNESKEISACQEGGNLAQLSLTTPENVTYPNPPEPKDMDAAPLSLAVDAAGSSWAAFTATNWSGSGTCIESPPRLYTWNGSRWVIERNNVLGVAFGPGDWMAIIQGHQPRDGGQWSGTLIVKEPGRQVVVASDVVGVTVPRE